MKINENYDRLSGGQNEENIKEMSSVKGSKNNFKGKIISFVIIIFLSLTNNINFQKTNEN